MENNENEKSEWLLKQLSSFGRSVAIDWLQDLDAGRQLTPFPSSYHKTGELWVNEDNMLEVLVAPYPGPEAEEHVISADHNVQTGGGDRVWQVVPRLPRWARFLRGNHPPDWPHVYGMAKRAREESEDEVTVIQSPPQKRAKRSRREMARRESTLHAEEEQRVEAILSTLTDAGMEELPELLDMREQQIDRQSEPKSNEPETKEALRVEAVDAELDNTRFTDREGSLELNEVDESTSPAPETNSPSAVPSSDSSEDDVSTTSSLLFVSNSPSESSDDASSESASESSIDSPSDSPSPSALLSEEGNLSPSSLFYRSTSPTPMRSSTSITAEDNASIASSVTSTSSSPCPSPRSPITAGEDITTLTSG